jgi:hypothetical protein
MSNLIEGSISLRNLLNIFTLHLRQRRHLYRDMGRRGLFTWLAGVNVWLTGLVQWPCQVGWLAHPPKNCRGFYLQTLFEKQIPEAKSYNIRLPFGAISFYTTPSLQVLQQISKQ